MKHYILTLFRHIGFKLVALLGLLIVTSIMEGVSLIMLVPFLQLVGVGVGREDGTSTWIVDAVGNAFQALDLPLTLPVVLGVFLVLIISRAVLQRLRDVIMAETRLRFVDTLRIDLHRAISNAGWSFLSAQRSAHLHHVLTADIDRVGQGTHYVLTFCVSSLVIIAYTVTAFLLSPLMTLLALAISAVLMAILFPYIRRSQQLGRRLTEAHRDVYSTVSQFLDGVKLAKSYAAEARHQQAFAGTVTELREQIMHFTRSYNGARLIYQSGAAIGLCTLLYLSTAVLQMPAAELLVLVLIFSRLLPMISSLQQTFQHAAYMLPAFESAMALQQQSLAAREAPAQTDTSWQPVLHDAISLQRLSYRYGDDHGDNNQAEAKASTLALREVSLQIPARQTTALVGPSGSGKSTLADLLIGLLQPSDGLLCIDGEPLLAEHLQRWRGAVAYVPQETFLFHESIRDNLRWARSDASDEQLWQTLSLVAAEEFVRSLPEGLNTVVGDRGLRLSGGERQRLALARALLRAPTLLILDEATSSLDTENELRIQQAIDNMHGELTILLIAHRLSTIRRADQVVVLESGQVIESGSWQRLMAQPDSRLKQMLAAGQPTADRSDV